MNDLILVVQNTLYRIKDFVYVSVRLTWKPYNPYGVTFKFLYINLNDGITENYIIRNENIREVKHLNVHEYV